jgi:Na+/melibiose symporter-like transporter
MGWTQDGQPPGWGSWDAHKTIQGPATIMGLRILFAVVPATAAFLAAIALRRYPLGREVQATIRARLEARRGAV